VEIIYCGDYGPNEQLILCNGAMYRLALHIIWKHTNSERWALNRHNCAQNIVIYNLHLVRSEIKCTATKIQKIVTMTTKPHRSN